MAELSESHRQIVDQSVNFEDFAFHLYLIKRGLGSWEYVAAIHLCFPTVWERMHFILGIYTQ
uniref:Uncharacterized protein n=1 Tax=Medicago truncatula TaxID=3880 RepID=I3T3G3_MEDTR|nr:unknown [Medicago truncatula]